MQFLLNFQYIPLKKFENETIVVQGAFLKKNTVSKKLQIGTEIVKNSRSFNILKVFLTFLVKFQETSLLSPGDVFEETNAF